MKSIVVNVDDGTNITVRMSAIAVKCIKYSAKRERVTPGKWIESLIIPYILQGTGCHSLEEYWKEVRDLAMDDGK